MKTRNQARDKRRLRIRRKVKGTPERPRLSVAKSGRHIYAQIVDDADGKTLAFLTTNRKSFKGDSPNRNFSNKESARRLGKELAEAAAKQGVCAVVFDRGGFKYHGVVQELADAAREAGLDF